MIQIERFNQTYIKVHCGDDIARELSDYFTFEVPGARFIPSVKNKKWDGKIKLFNSGTHHIYAGLIDYVRDFAKQNNYDVELLSDFSDEDGGDASGTKSKFAICLASCASLFSLSTSSAALASSSCVLNGVCLGVLALV